MNRILFSFTLCLLLAAAPNALAQSITVQGKVTDASGQPIAGSATQFRVQILSPDANRCVLYDETQTVDLSTTYGLFTVNLNSGSGTRNLPTTYALEDVISNRTGFAVSSTYCASGSGTITYTPSATDNRKVVIQFRDPATMTAWETIPEMDLNPVPYAIESRSVGGYPASSMLRVLSGSTPGTATPLTPSQFTELQNLVNGSSTNYMSSTTGATTGARLPTVGGDPASPTAGSIWFDTTGSGALKYYDSSGTVRTVGTGTGNGTITGVTAGTGLSGGGTSGAVTLSLNTTGVTSASYGSATAVPVLTVDAYGRITAASTTPITGVLPSGTSGEFLKSDGTNWSSQKITMADLKSTISGDLFSAPGCTAAQSLYWDSGTDTLRCQNIAIDASAITAGTIADARLADVGTAGTYKVVTTDAKGRVTAGSNPTTLAGFGITDAVLNAGGIPNVSSGVLTSRPAAASAGRLYVSTDNLTLYRDNGTTWDIIGAAGGGASITEVTAGAGLSGGGTSGNVTVSMPNVGTAGTYAKVTTDAQGRVTAGAALAAGDIPNLDWAKITSGKPTTLSGYGITDNLVQNAGSVVSFQAGTARPAFGTAGRFYYATNTNVLSYDTGAAWIDLTSGGGFAGNLAGDVTGPQGTTVVANVGGSTAANVNAATVLANAATDANTASAIVKRDASGNFAAGAGTLTSLVLKNGANTATISPSTVTSSYTLRLPPGQATGNQLLQSDTSGNLTWVNPTAATSVSVTAPITNSGTGTAPNIGISQASGSTNGYLSSTDWTTFNNKLGTALTAARIWVGNASNVATAVAPSGGVTMDNAGAFTVTKLQATAVSSTAPTSGHFLKYDGTNWLGASITMNDLRSTLTAGQGLFSSPGCTAAQSMYWDSGTDQIKCQNIAIDASAITAGTIADARLPASATYWQAATGGINYAGGNVGIGSTAPGYPLTVNVIGGSGNNKAGIQIINADTDTGLRLTNNTVGGRSWTLHSSGTGSSIGVGNFNIWDSSAGASRFSITNAGYVGIGTTDPTVGDGGYAALSSALLTVANGASSTGSSYLHLANMRTTPAAGHYLGGINFTFANNGAVPKAGYINMILSGSGGANGFGSELAFATKGDNTTYSEKVRISSAGYVGIGTTTPTSMLDIMGANESMYLYRAQGANTNAPNLRMRKARGTFPSSATTVANGDYTGHLSFEAYDGSAYVGPTGIMGIVNGTVAANSIPIDLVFGAGSAGTWVTNERMRIKSDGNVGIGTSNPGQKLAVAGSIIVDAAGANVGTNVNTLLFGNSASGEAIGSKKNAGGNLNGLDFYTAHTARISITNGGNVGIGTTAPNNNFEVNGGISVGSDKDATTQTTSWGAALSFLGANNNTDALYMARYNKSLDFSELRMVLGDNGGSDDALVVGAIPGGVWTPAMRVESRGWVGIGTDAPTTALDIVGGAGPLKLKNNAYGTGWVMGPDTGNSFVVYNGANTGVYLANGGTAWAANSDRRVKKQILPITDALTKIQELNGVTYRYKKDADDAPRLAGVIAQDVKKVLPEAVTEKDGVLAVKYTEIIPLVINAVKEFYHQWKDDSAALHAELTATKARLAKVEADAAAKEQELAALKAAVCEVNPRAKLCTNTKAPRQPASAKK